MKTFFDLLKIVKSKYKEKNTLSITEEGKTSYTSYKTLLENIDKVASFLHARGYKKDEKAVIMLESSPSWLACDLGIIKSGLVCVPMFSNIAFANMVYQFENSGARIIFIKNTSTFNIIKETGYKFDLVITIEKLEQAVIEGNKDYNIISLDEAMLEGFNNLETTKEGLAEIEKLSKEDDTASIIYTSGTSGRPKGVELTHKNLISQVASIDDDFEGYFVSGKDVGFSFLPLAHIFQRTIGYYFLFKCVDWHFSNDVKAVADNLEKFKPSAVAVVPRFLEKVKNGLNEKIMKEKSFLKKIIGQICLKYATNHEPTKKHSILYPLYDALMYKKLRQKLGGNINVMISGGAKLSDEVYRFFVNMGIPLYQGYGLTETSPVVAVNTPKANRIYSIGKAFKSVEVKLTAEKELLVKGPNVMKGYYNIGDEGARAIDENGFLHTGDLAEIDKDGFIYIVGRKKEQFKTSNGKFINPLKIEAMLDAIPGVETSCIVAEGRPFVTVVLFPNDEGAKNLQELEARLTTHIKNINEKLDRHENIHYFYLHNKPATIDAGQLTPSLKIVRGAIEKQFKVQLDDFYARFH
jgi:long-chain acyl-CoA synthetase